MTFPVLLDPTDDGSILKKRKLLANDPPRSDDGVMYEIAERVKQRRRLVTQTEVRQEITLSASSSFKTT